jgi:hypothetical protein
MLIEVARYYEVDPRNHLLRNRFLEAAEEVFELINDAIGCTVAAINHLNTHLSSGNALARAVVRDDGRRSVRNINRAFAVGTIDPLRWVLQRAIIVADYDNVYA